MKNTCFLFSTILLLIISACKKEIPDGCIDESKKNSVGCTGDLDYVCGCNNKTYSNACYALNDGVVSYKKGACK